MNRIVFFILALLMNSIAKAQNTEACKDTIVGSQYRTCVIADMETHVPVRDVIIHTDNGHWARSDYRGYWNMRYTFDSASVKREGYLETKIYSRNLPDTLFLLPKTTLTLDEVTIYGKDKYSDTYLTQTEVSKYADGNSTILHLYLSDRIARIYTDGEDT